MFDAISTPPTSTPKKSTTKGAKRGRKKRKSGAPGGSNKKKPKTWTDSPSSISSEELAPELEPINIDYLALLSDPKYENEGDVLVMDARDFTYDTIRKNGLSNPIVFTDQMDILGIEIPEFEFREVLDHIPVGQKIDVFDHSQEKTRNLPVATVVEEIEKPKNERKGPLNMLSLECSYFDIGQYIRPPRLVREIDWGLNMFPRDKFAQRSYPRVEKYAIMTMAGAYTEFHIDFAGTSVWYHVKKGDKFFFLVEPTKSTLHLFEEFNLAYRSGSPLGFFASFVEGSAKCTRVHVKPGQTLILPSGWMHAVYTPTDSLVYGGNFLHSFSIPMQITVRDQETRGQTKKKFTYPCYEQTLWYYVADVVRKALGKEYVRLIKREDYELLLAQQAENPALFASHCFDWVLPKAEFYDDVNYAEPCQLTFDSVDEKTLPPPVSFNEEYLSQMTVYEKAGLYKIKDILGDSNSVVRSRRNSRIAEGIRRPRHLLKDFEHIVDYITNLTFRINSSTTTKPLALTRTEEPPRLTTEKPTVDSKNTSAIASTSLPEFDTPDSFLEEVNTTDEPASTSVEFLVRNVKQHHATTDHTIDQGPHENVQQTFKEPVKGKRGRRKSEPDPKAPMSNSASVFAPKRRKSFIHAKPKRTKNEPKEPTPPPAATPANDPVFSAVPLGKKSTRFDYQVKNKQRQLLTQLKVDVSHKRVDTQQQSSSSTTPTPAEVTTSSDNMSPHALASGNQNSSFTRTTLSPREREAVVPRYVSPLENRRSFTDPPPSVPIQQRPVPQQPPGLSIRPQAPAGFRNGFQSGPFFRSPANNHGPGAPYTPTAPYFSPPVNRQRPPFQFVTQGFMPRGFPDYDPFTPPPGQQLPSFYDPSRPEFDSPAQQDMFRQMNIHGVDMQALRRQYQYSNQLDMLDELNAMLGTDS